MWRCQFINLLKFETRPSSLLNFGMANDSPGVLTIFMHGKTGNSSWKIKSAPATSPPESSLLLARCYMTEGLDRALDRIKTNNASQGSDLTDYTPRGFYFTNKLLHALHVYVSLGFDRIKSQVIWEFCDSGKQ